jgi:small subunit ribosomal protein S16
MVRIRLRRTGKTKQPSYRVVVADSRAPRDGKFIEIIGHYNPVQQPKVLEIKGDRARYWLGVGAQPSDTVVYLLKQVKVLDSDGKVTQAEAAAVTEA